MKIASLLRLPALCALAAAHPLTASAADAMPPAGPLSAEALTKKAAEYQQNLATRTKTLTRLPAGAVSVLDVPYVTNPIKGIVDSSSQTLDLYVPKGHGPFPLIVWIHGGAWKGGDKGSRGSDLAVRWLPEGFAVASVNYRFVWDSEFPGMFQDALDAVGWLRANAGKYHLDPKRIGVIGESAGAHIAGVLAMASGSPVYARSGTPVQAAVLWAGFYDMTTETGQWKPGAFIANSRDDFAYLYPKRAYDPAIAKKISPVYLIHPEAPPVLLVHGDKDTTAPRIQTDLFEAALRKANHPVTTLHPPDYAHDLGKPDVFAATLDFFKTNLSVK